MVSKVLVANRGEIAVRVFRSCADLGIGTVAIYSDADRHAGHVRYADEAYNVGPAPASESYLDQDRILEVAESAAADAIHPGYGFLAENADFARRVESSPFTWIGPPADVMDQLGEKTTARQVMADAGVPIVPGTAEPVDSIEDATAIADDIGYPIVIKAVGGGGGRGLQVVDEPSGLESAFERASREGKAYFDNPAVYLEKYLEQPKHIEVQILADDHGTVRHLGERDCSLQRRQQKIIEESPSPALDADLRAAIGTAATEGVAATGYTNAGTVEFLVEDGEFYFMEVNTRIQVEHCVTEAVTGIDIVAWQLRIAAGESIDFDQSDVELDGHAIEYRINTENPAEQFSPSLGRLERYNPPGGIGIRIDDAVRHGDDIGGDYDSMIAKLIVFGTDRDECIARSRRALAEYEIDGLHTTIPFHRAMLEDDVFLDGTHTTDYLDEQLDGDVIAAAVDRWGPESLSEPTPRQASRTYTVEVNGKRFDVTLETDEVTDATQGSNTSVRRSESNDAESASVATGDGTVVAEMQGTILSVAVDVGDSVDRGDVLCVLEAMKMENEIVANRAGTIAAVAVAPGDSVGMGDPIVTIE